MTIGSSAIAAALCSWNALAWWRFSHAVLYIAGFCHGIHLLGIIFMRSIRPETLLALVHCGPLTYVVGHFLLLAYDERMHVDALFLVSRLDALFSRIK